jgi:calcineurin-like phosphoesterase
MKEVKKIMMIGDVVGNPGLDALEKLLPHLIAKRGVGFTVVNGENAADGFGMTEATLSRILACGADAVTSGNHVWEKREFWPILESEARVLRPANYPAGTVGRGAARFEKDGASYLVVNLQGRELMQAIDCPFRGFDAVFEGQCASADAGAASVVEGPASPGAGGRKPITLVDFHAEAAQEKEALAFYLDGRASVVVGTHTHVQTADNRLLPKGTAYITDLGMTGVTESIIGMDTKICLNRARKQVLYHMECAEGTATVQGIIADIDEKTGFSLSIERISVKNI